MDVLYPVCAGIDVHRDTLVVTVSRAVERRARSETRTFGAVTEEVRALVAWLDEQEVPIVAMESTGVYWKPVYRAIRTLNPTRTVWLVNPAHIKAVPGRKTDVKDSAWIAKLLMHGLLAPSFVPEVALLELRDSHALPQEARRRAGVRAQPGHQAPGSVQRAARIGRERSARQGGARDHRGAARRRQDPGADCRDGGPPLARVQARHRARRRGRARRRDAVPATSDARAHRSSGRDD